MCAYTYICVYICIFFYLCLFFSFFLLFFFLRTLSFTSLPNLSPFSKEQSSDNKTQLVKIRIIYPNGRFSYKIIPCSYICWNSAIGPTGRCCSVPLMFPVPPLCCRSVSRLSSQLPQSMGGLCGLFTLPLAVSPQPMQLQGGR